MSQLVPYATAAKVASSGKDDHKFGSTIPLSEPYWSVRPRRRTGHSFRRSNDLTVCTAIACLAQCVPRSVLLGDATAVRTTAELPSVTSIDSARSHLVPHRDRVLLASHSAAAAQVQHVRVAVLHRQPPRVPREGARFRRHGGDPVRARVGRGRHLPAGAAREGVQRWHLCRHVACGVWRHPAEGCRCVPRSDPDRRALAYRLGWYPLACFFTFGIALPPILNVGSQYIKDLCARDVITGKKIMALAVTEPQAGSDVANLLTTATREGDFYIVNGLKKFISGGMKASWFTVAVRTGGAGMGGVSLLLVDANSEGIRRTRMKTQGWWISTTTLIAFDNVKVPVKNLIGKENSGFSSIMRNFNHERFVFAAMSNRYARVCLEEAIKYGRVRKTFGKPLIAHQVIRHKVAEMSRQVEATHAMLEQVAYQMKSGVDDKVLSGMFALTKVAATKTMDFCAREATQILGGAACVRGGPGEKVERLYREVRLNAIAGGSEEVLIDLAMRQAKL